MLYQFGNSGLFMPVCLRSQPSCHASLKFAGYSNLLNEDILKMSNLKLSQPGVYELHSASDCSLVPDT